MNPNHHDAIRQWIGRAGVILALVGLFLLPLPAWAATTYFCNANVSEGGNGSATSPWACADEAQLEAVLNTVCTNGGGTLYRSLSDSFVTYNVEAVENAGCTVASQITPGQPPTSGGDSLSSSLLLVVGLVGAAALIIGLVLRLRPTRP